MRYGAVVVENMFVQDRKEQLTNAVLGLTGEAGEISDFFKKIWFHPIRPGFSEAKSLEDLRYELGDLLWYLAALNQLVFGDSLLERAKENIEKLRMRWPDRYIDVDINKLTL